jgi:hypothetical protein
MLIHQNKSHSQKHEMVADVCRESVGKPLYVNSYIKCEKLDALMSLNHLQSQCSKFIYPRQCLTSLLLEQMYEVKLVRRANIRFELLMKEWQIAISSNSVNRMTTLHS